MYYFVMKKQSVNVFQLYSWISIICANPGETLKTGLTRARYFYIENHLHILTKAAVEFYIFNHKNVNPPQMIW